MGATEVYLKVWHALKLRWHLRGTGVLKWQLCNEVLSANKQYQERVPEMHQGCAPQYFNHHSPDDESKTIAVADINMTFGAFQWCTFTNQYSIIITSDNTTYNGAHIIIIIII